MIVEGERPQEKTEDEQKEDMIESLKSESLSVICLAYVYAKKFEETGIDITERWETVEQQTAIIQDFYNKGYRKGYTDGLEQGKILEREEHAQAEIEKKYWKQEWKGDEFKPQEMSEAIRHFRRNPTKKKRKR